MNTTFPPSSKQILLDQKPRGSYRFIPRNLRMETYDYIDFQKVQIKGFYVRKLIHLQNRTYDNFEERIYKTFKKKKMFKTLKHATVPAGSQTYIPENLKYSKNLKSFFLISEIDTIRLSQIVLLIKKTA